MSTNVCSDVWLFDNTAYRPTNEKTGELEPWQAEFVAAFFHKGRKDITKAVADLADTIGLDKDVGKNPTAAKVMEERLQYFVQGIAPARTAEIVIPSPGGSSQTRTLGPSDANGISSQTLLTGGPDDANGKNVTCSATGFPTTTNNLHFAAPEGWVVVSDIDDTIKKTMTPDPLGVLKSTFVDEPEVIKGMPELYRTMDESFKPAWFYLSASPYNLYAFLHEFLTTNFRPGTLILRDKSWMFFAGLLQSLTEGVEEYKVDRLEKIHHWLPRRKAICIGDSTQSDPEAYASIYRKHPDWIKAIYIRRVTEAPFMAKKNEPKRFEDAFKDVPAGVWTVFDEPSELQNKMKHLTGALH